MPRSWKTPRKILYATKAITNGGGCQDRRFGDREGMAFRNPIRSKLADHRPQLDAIAASPCSSDKSRLGRTDRPDIGPPVRRFGIEPRPTAAEARSRQFGYTLQ